MNEIKAVVFDVDGTILNTFEHIVQAFEKVLPQHGAVADRESIRKVIGHKLVDCYKQLVPDGDHEAMATLHHETQQTPEMYELIVAYDAMRETVEALHTDGIASAVLTNRGRESVHLIFGHIGITGLFDVIVTPEDVDKPKPDPQGILLISQKLKIPAHAMVMVGDTVIDIHTAKNAEMAGSIGITHGFGTQKELEDAGASIIIDGLDTLPDVIKRRM